MYSTHTLSSKSQVVGMASRTAPNIISWFQHSSGHSGRVLLSLICAIEHSGQRLCLQFTLTAQVFFSDRLYMTKEKSFICRGVENWKNWMVDVVTRSQFQLYPHKGLW